MIVKNCFLCGKEFYTYPSKVKIGRGKYCSKECSNKVTLIKNGQQISPDTQIKKGQKLALGIKKETVWNKGIKGVCKPNSGSFKQGECRSPETQFKKDTPTHLHPRWLGGKSFEPYGVGWNKTCKEQIRYRDLYRCGLCGTPESELNRRLSVHHIDYNKKNLSEKNLISLCIKCHMKTNTNREHWKKYFEEVILIGRKDSKKNIEQENISWVAMETTSGASN